MRRPRHIALGLLFAAAGAAWVGAVRAGEDSGPPEAAAEAAGPVFSTWRGHVADVDTCAAAWLIKRRVAPDARFQFLERGRMDLEGTPFGVPQADLCLQRNKTTFEVVMDTYGLDDDALLMIARIVRNVELNKWGDKVTDEAKGLEALMRGAALRAGDDDAALLETGLVLFDCLYADAAARLDPRTGNK